MVCRVWRIAVLLACIGVSLPAAAEYAAECRALAQTLAQDPGALSMGELDILKNCVSGLQRGIVLKEPPPARGEALACEPAAPAAPVACPVCPTAATLCPKREPAPAVRERPAREREPAEDRRLKPNYPKF